MRELLDQSLGANITVNFELASGLPPATADVNQLELAILNLSINSRDAMPDGGTLTITTEIAPDDPRSIRSPSPIPDRNAAGRRRAGLRSVFHDQADRQRHRSWVVAGLWHSCGKAAAMSRIESEVGKGTIVTLRLPRAAHDFVLERPDRRRFR